MIVFNWLCAKSFRHASHSITSIFQAVQSEPNRAFSWSGRSSSLSLILWSPVQRLARLAGDQHQKAFLKLHPISAYELGRAGVWAVYEAMLIAATAELRLFTTSSCVHVW